jgi:SIT4-associating protein SAP185/190
MFLTNVHQWLHSQDLMPILLSFLSAEHSWATQTSAGDFLKAIITISANASQNEQSCIGPNELTRQLVSHSCVEKLISDMLKGGNPLTVGVGIVIEVIRKNNSDYDPDVGAEANSAPSSRDPIYLGTLLRMFAKHVPDFMALILSPNHTIGGGDGPVSIKRKELSAAFGSKIEPLGFDRFKTCELMAELLHCSNMGLLNEVGSEDFVRTRDLERERLKTEGKLGVSGESGRDSGNDDLAMRSSTLGRLGSSSPDEMRRLEIQNASDDDGFEEVTHVGALGDDSKDEFIEKPDMEEDVLTPTKPETSLAFMDKDDEEFVDEPLSSPRLNADADLFKEELAADPSLTVLPLSPTKDLSNNVAGLNFGDEAKEATQSEDTVESIAIPAIVADKQSQNDLETVIKPSTSPMAESHVPPSVPSLQILSSSLELHDGGLSPHPEDKPAPLFTKKVDDQSFKAVDALLDQQVEASTSLPAEAESVDITMVDAGDGTTSILIGNPEESKIEDLSSAPVVGDYLKMQFVEHKVVPTIIVSLVVTKPMI